MAMLPVIGNKKYTYLTVRQKLFPIICMLQPIINGPVCLRKPRFVFGIYISEYN